MTNVKVFCPKCQDELRETFYETSLNILKLRIWYICTNCKFSVDKDLYWSNINRV